MFNFYRLFLYVNLKENLKIVEIVLFPNGRGGRKLIHRADFEIVGGSFPILLNFSSHLFIHFYSLLVYFAVSDRVAVKIFLRINLPPWNKPKPDNSLFLYTFLTWVKVETSGNFLIAIEIQYSTVFQQCFILVTFKFFPFIFYSRATPCVDNVDLCFNQFLKPIALTSKIILSLFSFRY